MIPDKVRNVCKYPEQTFVIYFQQFLIQISYPDNFVDVVNLSLRTVSF